MAAMKKAVAKKAVMSKKADMKQDAKAMKGMNPFQKGAFKKADAAMDKKKPSAKADMKMDTALRAKIMKKGK
jgi:hypothetical protein